MKPSLAAHAPADVPAAPNVNARREKTRDRIIAAAAKLMSERAIDGVSIDDITQAARVAKGSFYNHFADKDALAREIGRGVREQAETAIAALNEGLEDPVARIARGMCYYAKVAVNDPVCASLMAQSMPQDLSALMTPGSGLGVDIAKGIATGRLRVATRESAATFVVGAGAALIQRLLAEGNATTAVMFSQQVVSLTLRGLGLDIQEADRLAAQAADQVIPLAS